MKHLKGILLLAVPLIFASCGAYFNQPVGPQEARIGEVTFNTSQLSSLPLPQEPIVVGVYNFKDQTGQYKSVENGSTFSTAVSQGATSILIKALEDSKWFTPIERENLSNLLNERNIIRSTREEFRQNNQPQPQLPPLLFAGVLLEGGVISYDSNIITGGFGARYFGAGGSTQYRQDRLTIYLRAVSTSNGEILKTVYTSKTILSQAIDASLFRYVKLQRLLEVETGITKNEPIQLAMKDAIETAVRAMIVEGIADGLWNSREGAEVDEVLVKEYSKEKEEEESTLLYNRTQKDSLYSFNLGVNGIATLFNGDFDKKKLSGGTGISMGFKLTPHLDLMLAGAYQYFEGGNSFAKEYIDSELNLEYIILPYDNLTPFVYGGVGSIFDLHTRNPDLTEKTTAFKLQYGAGVKIALNRQLELLLFAENNHSFSDALDEVVNGKRDDFYYNFGLGLQFNFGQFRGR
jgi:curli production assembly/transport component CsgG